MTTKVKEFQVEVDVYNGATGPTGPTGATEPRANRIWQPRRRDHCRVLQRRWTGLQHSCYRASALRSEPYIRAGRRGV